MERVRGRTSLVLAVMVRLFSALNRRWYFIHPLSELTNPKFRPFYNTLISILQWNLWLWLSVLAPAMFIGCSNMHIGGIPKDQFTFLTVNKSEP